MKTLVFQCEQCKKTFKLDTGTTRMGAEADAKKDKDGWLAKLRLQNKKHEEDFSEEITGHMYNCDGKISLEKTSRAC